MPGSQPLPGGAQVANQTLDGSGNGVAQSGPQLPRQHWQIANVAVKCSSNNNEATCSVYVGSSLSTATFAGSTFTGSTGDNIPLGGFDIQPGQFVFAQWSGGDAGATATMTVFGTYTTGAPASFLGAIGAFLNRVIPFFRAGNTTIINSKGLFIYNGKPALGNLLANISPTGGTDNFGNPYVGIEGIYGTKLVGGGIPTVQLGLVGGTSPAILFPSGSVSEQSVAQMVTQVFNVGLPTESSVVGLFGPESTATPLDRAAIQLNSSGANNPGVATGFLDYQSQGFQTANVIQSKTGTVVGSVLTITLNTPTTQHNTLVVCIGASATGTSPTISSVQLGGVPDHFAADVPSLGGAAFDPGAIWSDPDCAGGQTAVRIAVTGGVGTINITAVVHEVSGLPLTSSFDQSQNNGGVGTVSGAWSSGATPALSQANEIAFGMDVGAATGIVLTGPGAPWTNLPQAGPTTCALMTGYQVVSSTAALTYAGTAAPNSGSTAIIATYKAAPTVGLQTHQLLAWGGEGVGRQSVAGLNGGIPLNNMDFFTRTANAAGLTALTTNYGIPADDASVPGSQQTTYHLRMGGTGNAGNPAQNAQYSFVAFGTNVYASNNVPRAVAGDNFTWLIDADIMISGNAVNASFIIFGFAIFTDTATGASQVTAVIGGNVINNTAPGNLVFNWNWQGVVGGATISCPGSIFTRKGV